MAYLSPMDTKRPYHAFTMIKPKKQNTDFRFTHQGTKHDKDKIAITYLKRLIIYSLLARPMSKAKRAKFLQKISVWFNLSWCFAFVFNFRLVINRCFKQFSFSCASFGVLRQFALVCLKSRVQRKHVRLFWITSG